MRVRVMIAIGDAVAAALQFFGITKERVSRVTGRADCGCQQRQQQLNELGFSWQRRLGDVVERVTGPRVRWVTYWRTSRFCVAWRLLCMAFRTLLFGNPH